MAEQVEKIEIMRSQLGRVRGLGAGHTGTHHWWVERVTAVALVPLTLWFVLSVLSLLGADWASTAAWIGRPLHAALLLALIAMTFHHLQLGMQVVYEDYIDARWLQTLAILATQGVALIAGLLAAIAVLKLALAAHG
jgi:succinate dehydrogenase / fumarate reductase membrane anchor subunit